MFDDQTDTFTFEFDVLFDMSIVDLSQIDREKVHYVRWRITIYFSFPSKSQSYHLDADLKQET